MRDWARDELNRLVADPPCACCRHRPTPIHPADPYHELYLDRGVPEREHRGLQLLAAGWTP
jgi:hypothetical protein